MRLAARHFAEQNAAFCLRRLLSLDQRYGHLLGGRAGIFDHGLRDVLHQAALLLERAALNEIDDDFRHLSLSMSALLPACLKNGRVLSESSREGTTGSTKRSVWFLQLVYWRLISPRRRRRTPVSPSFALNSAFAGSGGITASTRLAPAGRASPRRRISLTRKTPR